MTFDHRGHGRSEVTAVGYDMDSFAADAAGLIEALGCSLPEALPALLPTPGERSRDGSTARDLARALLGVGCALLTLSFSAARMDAGAAPAGAAATSPRAAGAATASGSQDLFVPTRATDAGDAASRELEAYLRIAAVAGREQAAAAFIRERLGRGLPVRSDALGNLTVTFGSGRPRRLVACPLGEPGFVVNRIDGDGYLRLAAADPDSPAGAPWQQAHEGQLVWVASGRGRIPGVVAARSIHLQPRAEPAAPP
ncbi:MAG TPA: hypothetical protein VJA16_06185, partial [Thermoanaerobaculia bacterium]